MTNTISHEDLTLLLAETSQRHHQAYIETDGGDPEWPLWYAGYLQAQLWDRAGRLPGHSELIYLLVKADRDFTAPGVEGPWPSFYASALLEALGAD
jgi:NAD(P)H-hydrate epimerase